MPRIARVVVPGCPHHITQRGNYKQIVFEEKRDYKKYLSWIAKYSKEYGLKILAYCLMPNHVHFIGVPKKKNSLAKTFNTCHMMHSQYFNKKKRKTGHLWQGRFYSCALEGTHLYSALRYVENNPVRAKLVKAAEDWEYSSANAHLNNTKSNLLARVEEFIEIENWRRFLKEEAADAAIKQIRANTLTGRPLGSESFVKNLEKILGLRLFALKRGRPKK